MLVGDDNPLTVDSAFRLGSFIDGCAVACWIIKGWLRITMATARTTTITAILDVLLNNIIYCCDREMREIKGMTNIVNQ